MQWAKDLPTTKILKEYWVSALEILEKYGRISPEDDA